MTIGVYIITCETNGRYYIGSSTDVDKRIARHLWSLRKGTHHNVYMQRVFDKYGEDSFQFQILKEKTLDDCRALEDALLDYHVDQSLCMNIGRTACGGDNLTNNPNRQRILKRIKRATVRWMSSMTPEERKEKFGKTGEANGMYGRTHSKQARKKISEAAKGNVNALGAVRGAEQRALLSELAKLRTGEKNPFYGKTHSSETRDRISAANIGRVPPNVKAVRIGKKKFSSMKEASEVLGIPVPTIHYRVNSPKFTEYRYD